MGTSPSTHRRAADRRAVKHDSINIISSVRENTEEHNQEKDVAQEGIRLSDYTVQFTISLTLIPLNFLTESHA